MKTNLRSLKTNLSKLTDLDYLKKEISRIANDIKTETKREAKKIDSHLTPGARAQLERLEKRFHDLMATLSELQKQVDANLDKFMHLVRDKRGSTVTTTSKKKAAKKSAPKSTPQSEPKSAPKSAPNADAKPAAPKAAKKAPAKKKAAASK